MQACHNLLESNSVLEKLSIRIANPPDADPLGEVVAANPPDGELLEEAGSDVNWASEEDLQVVSLEEVARATALRTRLAVMMGLHPRAGRLCPLRILPEEVLERILDFVVPKRGCKVEIVLSDEFPYFERQGRAMTFSPAY